LFDALDRAALMAAALEEARAALGHDDVPIGALVVDTATGEVVAAAHNERELRRDPTAHAEVLALALAAKRRGTWRLDDCVCVVTLEPCPMCAGALWAARIGGVIYAAADDKAGALGTLYNLASDPRLNHEFAVERGVGAEESAELLRAFFAKRRTGPSPTGGSGGTGPPRAES
jgi:tRNA(adenine34) deaminase